MNGREDYLSKPTFSVVIRTQGSRPVQLAEALESICAGILQPQQVIVVTHNARGEKTHEIIEQYRDRLTLALISVEGGTRAAPLAAAIPKVQTSHVVFLDDDDLALPNWLSEFSEALGMNSNRQGARARALVQSWGPSADPETSFVPYGEAEDLYPHVFDLIDHLVVNRTPFMAVAFPTALFHERTIVVDEQLVVCEDWDLLLQLGFAAEIVDVPKATTIYRRWVDLDTSYSTHNRAEWEWSEQRVRDGLVGRAMQLTPRRLQHLTELVTLADEEPELRAAKVHWQNVQRSRAWRLIRRIRGEW